MSAVEVASMFGLLTLKDEMSGGLDAAEQKAKGFGERISEIGSQIATIGGSMTALTAPFIAGMGAAVGQSWEFGSSMTNVQAVLGLTTDDMALMNAQVLALGESSRQGPQAAALAMYDIAGGVADASTHMDILSTSLDVATGSSADLDGVVNAMIKTMNIYGMEAEDAARAGDVFTRMVGMGVGTANEFASALPPVEGLANELGISFDDLGGYMAYMSSQSSSVAEGGTALKGVMSKLMNPSTDLANAIKKMGYASGEAMVEQEGLVGSLKLIKKFGGGSFAGLITDQEALLGAIALTKDGADDFFTTYTEGIDGATEAAKAIQMTSPAAQFDLLKSSVSGLAISIGDALTPAITEITGAITPIIGSISEWVRANPELVQQIGTAIAVVGALGVGLTALGVAIGIVGGAFTALTSPIGIAVGAAAALFAAYQTNFGGVRDFIDTQVRPKLDEFFGFLGTVWETTVKPGLEGLYNWFVADGFPKITTAVNDVKTGVETVFNWLAGVWTTILQPGLQPIVDWFVSGEAWQMITTAANDVKVSVETVFNWLAGVWTTLLQPALQPIVDWFLSGDAWQMITTAANDVKTGVETVFNWFAGVWETILKPGLQPIVTWFTSGESWKAITGAVNDVKTGVETVFNWFAGVWETTLKPGIQPIVDWFISGTGWQQITSAATDVKTKFDEVVDGIKTAIDGFITTVKGVWSSISGAVSNIANGIDSVLGPVRTVIDGLSQALSDLIAAIGGTGGEVTVTTMAGDPNIMYGPRPSPADLAAAMDPPGKAIGGPVGAHTPYVVGEEGEELFIPDVPGTIVPHKQTRQMMGGSGVNIQQLVINADTEEGGRAAARGFKEELGDYMGERG